MDVEGLIVGRLLTDRDFQSFLQTGISHKDFSDPLHSKVYRLVSEHADKYGEIPSVDLVKENFPNYKVLNAPDTFGFYVDQFRGRKLNTDLRLAGDEFLSTVEDDKDYTKGIEAASALVSKINEMLVSVAPVKDFNVAMSAEERINEYEEYEKRRGELLGIPTGFPILDLATGGLQPEQLITVTGLPKAGKSTIMMLMAIAAHEYGKRPMLLTFEMSNIEMKQRHDAIRAQISHHRLRNRQLTPVEKRALYATLRRLESMQDFIFIEDISATTRISQIHAKIEQYDPDCVFVDGAYMLEDESGDHPQGSSFALTNVTRGLKRLAQRTRKPVVISHQSLHSKTSKATGLSASSMGYSSSFAQDSDVVFGIERNEQDRDLAIMKIIISRNCPAKRVKIHWDYDTGQFQELEEMEDDE